MFRRGGRVCDLHYPGPCGLHARRVLDGVGVDIVDTLVVMAPDSTNLGIELAKATLVYWGTTGYYFIDLRCSSRVFKLPIRIRDRYPLFLEFGLAALGRD